MEYRFVADQMLGRLARMLRLLGYDTAYSPSMIPREIEDLARREQRVLLTRGNATKRFPGLENALSLKSDYAPEQLREVVERFRLDTQAGLWTRCTVCNAPIQPIEKGSVKSKVDQKIFERYQEFFECAGCKHIYWQGSHVARILRNLAAVLGKRKTEDGGV